MKKHIAKKDNYPIDIVIPWVDGNDPAWLEVKRQYTPDEYMYDGVIRYRYWDNLQYIFRGIEQFAPWVNNIFFITWGHTPAWLNITHPKLIIVKHTDYIPLEYLPTFNTNTIELNFHRIKELSEHFVYFNDDTFLIKKTKREDFFKNGIPCDSAILNAVTYTEKDSWWAINEYRATGLLNKHFNFKNVLKSNINGWFNFRYGKKLLRAFFLSHLFWGRFHGILVHHLPSSLCKSVIKQIWEKEYKYLHQTSCHRFRGKMDITQCLFRYWQLASNNFYPRSFDVGKSFSLINEKDFLNVLDYIDNRKGKMICINDADISDDVFIRYKNAIIESFERILPQKSTFEI